MLHAGFTSALLYTADGAEELTRGSLPGLPAAVDFGTGDAEHSFALYRKLHPEGPYFCAEYWAGWFDHWGAKHEHTDAAKQVAEIRWMLKAGLLGQHVHHLRRHQLRLVQRRELQRSQLSSPTSPATITTRPSTKPGSRGQSFRDTQGDPGGDGRDSPAGAAPTDSRVIAADSVD